MIAVPTIATIRDQIIGDIEGKIGTTTPILAKAFVRVLATALAGVMALAYRFGAWAYRQIFPQTADEEALVRIGESYGLARTAAVAAVITATATGDEGTIVPAETLWLYGDQVYRQTTASTVSSGSAAITLEALTAGDAGNLANGTELSISSPLSGMDGTATVASTVTTGEDAEDIEDYRTRVIDRIKNKPQGGAAPDYVIWAREVAGVVKAFAYRTAPGWVTVYPLVSLVADRIPDAAKLAEVEAYVNDERRRPLNAQVTAEAMTEVQIDLSISGLSPNTPTVRAAIEAAFEDYLFGRFPKQYSDEANPTDTISVAALYGIAVAAGALTLSISMEVDYYADTSYTLAEGELAKLGTVTWI